MTGDDRRPAGWPHPNERPCDQCGHIWFAGERSHDYVDHAAEHHEDVPVLCTLCRQQQRLPRAEPYD